MPGPGLEPGCPLGHKILSLARLPVSPSRRADRTDRETGEPSLPRVRFRAGNGTRTRDPNLGKVVLYQLSYSRVRRKCNGSLGFYLPQPDRPGTPPSSISGGEGN